MSEAQFALAVLALVRVAAAVAMFDLFRRLRKPSTGILAAGLSLFALAPLFLLVFGERASETAMFATQTAGLILLLAGVARYFVTFPARQAAAVAVVGGAAAAVVSLLPAHVAVENVIFLIAISGIAVMFAVTRERFERIAGNSYAWGLVICAVAIVMLSLRLFADQSSAQVFDDFLRITISVSIGLYLLNLEFNVSYIARGHSEARYRTLFDTAGDAILISDFMGNILDANQVAAVRLGYDVRELRQMHLSQIDDKTSAELVSERLDRVRDEGSAVFESVQRRRDGSALPVEISAVLTSWEGEPAVLGNIRDLTERKANEELVVRMAYYDALTGLANRALFNDRLVQALVHARRSGEGLALFFIDLDNFKAVNDTLGHPVGDQLLRLVASRLCKVVREDDTVARFGGDEYTLLLPQLSTQENATTIAWKLLEALQEPFQLGDEHDVHVSASIGIAISQSGTEDAAELIRNADIAMFRAKERGRNTFQFYDPAMNAMAVERFQLKNELRRALEAEEIQLHFQPLLAIRTGKIVGAEALARWTSPTRGAIPPGTFIPLAEESGLIVPLGRYVLERACRALQDWHEAGFTDIRVAVNLSARQLAEDDLVSQVTGLLSECGVDPSCLEIEVTETIAMHDQSAVVEAFEGLNKTGVRIAIDDFGTGYSSLDRLKQLPIHTLKIAQPFIDDLVDSVDSAAIVTTIIVLGRSLGLNVVAEGVESAEQLDFLEDHRCDEMQGFLFSPAVPKEQFEQMLRERTVLTLKPPETA